MYVCMYYDFDFGNLNLFDSFGPANRYDSIFPSLISASLTSTSPISSAARYDAVPCRGTVQFRPAYAPAG